MAATEALHPTAQVLLGFSAAYHKAAGQLAGFPFTLITSWDLMYGGTIGNRSRGLAQTLWGWYVSRIRELSDGDAEAWQALEVCAWMLERTCMTFNSISDFPPEAGLSCCCRGGLIADLR